jgi:hypothetical protein
MLIAQQRDLLLNALKDQPGFLGKTVPYRLFWVEKFCQDIVSLDSFRTGKAGATRLLLFREELRVDGRWEDWQMAQAEETIYWFLKYYLGVPERELQIEIEREHFGEWKNVFSKMGSSWITVELGSCRVCLNGRGPRF